MSRIKEVTLVVETNKTEKEIVGLINQLYPNLLEIFPEGNFISDWEECLEEFGPNLLFSNKVFRISYKACRKLSGETFIYFYCKDKGDPDVDRFKGIYVYELKKLLKKLFENCKEHEGMLAFPSGYEYSEKDLSWGVISYKELVMKRIHRYLDSIDRSLSVLEKEYDKIKESQDEEYIEKWQKEWTEKTASYNEWVDHLYELVGKRKKEMPTF